MDKKSKIVLVIGIILSIAGLVSLVSAFDPEVGTCSVILTTEEGLSSFGLPPGCRESAEVPRVVVPAETIERLQSQFGRAR